MKKVLVVASLLVCVAVFASQNVKADTVISFGNVPLGPFGSSGSMNGAIGNPLDFIDVAFVYPGSTDGSWSSDYYFIITDPSGDVVSVGSGDGNGDINYALGTPTGVNGSPVNGGGAGSFGTTFSLALLQAVSPTFGEAGTYSVFVADGYGGGSNVETLGNVTVTLGSAAIPEPGSAIFGLCIAGLALVRRRK